MTEPSPESRRAAAFKATRAAHSTEIAEDYVELIGDLIAMQGEARLADLAENMGVSHATAAKVVQRLKLLGLVQSRPYRSIFLTAEGEAIAEQSRRRHKVVFEFLCALGVDAARAEIEAEGIEHHVGAATLDLMALRTSEWRAQPSQARSAP